MKIDFRENKKERKLFWLQALTITTSSCVRHVNRFNCWIELFDFAKSKRNLSLLGRETIIIIIIKIIWAFKYFIWHKPVSCFNNKLDHPQLQFSLKQEPYTDMPTLMSQALFYTPKAKKLR